MSICLPDKKINIQKVLYLIPDDLLSKLAQDTKVDYCSKVLYGQQIFNLLLYGLLTTDRTSKRTLEDLFGSKLFKSLLISAEKYTSSSVQKYTI